MLRGCIVESKRAADRCRTDVHALADHAADLAVVPQVRAVEEDAVHLRAMPDHAPVTDYGSAAQNAVVADAAVLADHRVALNDSSVHHATSRPDKQSAAHHDPIPDLRAGAEVNEPIDLRAIVNPGRGVDA